MSENNSQVKTKSNFFKIKEDTMKRILTIDGGGIKGVCPASFLATVDNSIEGNIADYFDLIVGTSTGGIIALGLGLGLSAKEILTFYEEFGPVIFGGTRGNRWFRWPGTTKYSSAPLQKALETCFGNKKLGDSRKRLVIPSLNLENGKVHIYKTAHHPRLELDYKEKVVDVALATAAAPTYFPTHHSSVGIPLIDGGIWANNPVGMSVVEAITVLDWPKDSLKVLSLGCTTEPLNVNKGRRTPLGKPYWAFKLFDVFMHAQSSASLGTAQLLAGHDNVTRIDENVSEGKFSLDGIEEIDSLKGMGAFQARHELPKLREVFLGDPAESFKPFHKLHK